MKYHRLALSCLFFLCLWHIPAQAAVEFSLWIDNTIKEAVVHGVRPETAYNELSKVTFDEGVIEKEEKQPEKTLTAEAYWEKMLTSRRIERAKSFYAANSVVLHQIGDAYGVHPRYLVALLSMESEFGQVQGDNLIIPSLASLAYASKRGDFFKSELFAALKILDKRHITAEEMVGSWAGAMGWCQFMPSTFLKYGQDFDGDGRIDIWSSVADAAASAANYLHEIGWRNHESWGRRVRLTKPISDEYVGRDIKRKISEWTAMGVRNVQGRKISEKQDMEASLILPDGAEGAAFLVYNNFDVIMQWNKSTYFATTIGMLADRL